MDATESAARKILGPFQAAAFVASKLFLGIRRRFGKPDEAELDDQLESRRLVRPRISHQRAWAERFRPEIPFRTELGSWRLLQQYTLPLTRSLATEAHRRGIEALGLEGDSLPPFEDFRGLVEHRTGWQILPATGELSADAYFSLLAARKFPCIAGLRPVEQVLCGSRPDFWHEAIGHVAPLVDPAISRFYEQCAELHVGLIHRARYVRARELEKLLWVLLEYGFLREAGGYRAFGAAVSGSFVALTKWKLGRWIVLPFDPARVLASGLFEESREPERDSQGRLIFYGMESLPSAYRRLREFADSAD